MVLALIRPHLHASPQWYTVSGCWTWSVNFHTLWGLSRSLYWQLPCPLLANSLCRQSILWLAEHTCWWHRYCSSHSAGSSGLILILCWYLDIVSFLHLLMISIWVWGIKVLVIDLHACYVAHMQFYFSSPAYSLATLLQCEWDNNVLTVNLQWMSESMSHFF